MQMSSNYTRKNIRAAAVIAAGLAIGGPGVPAQEAALPPTGAALPPAAPVNGEAYPAFYRAVVRIQTTAQVPDYRMPWNAGAVKRGSGAGFYLGDNRFMTNAHVVSNARLITIKKYGDPRQYPAKILHIAHDCDLALLALEDPAPFRDVEPLTLGGIPKLNSAVAAYGYPVGGRRLSVTRGVVSRTDFQSYSHSGADQHLAIQIDAAINPGNSGGPVIQDDKVVGVAFQGYSANVAQNVGYMIPIPVVRRFLKDIEDGRYDRYVDVAISDFPLINPVMRMALGVPGQDRGVYISRVNSAGPAHGFVKEGDVLLELDGMPVASDGFVEYQGERVNMNEIVERKFKGDALALKVLRDGQEIDLEVKLRPFEPYLIQANMYGKRPRYVMFGGLVFQPLNKNVVVAHRITDPLVSYHFHYFTNDEIFKERPEIVVLTSILPDSINTHLSGFVNSIVDEINGVKIKGLKDVAKALDLTKETDYYVIKVMGDGLPIVLSREKMLKAQERIQGKYRVANASFIGEEEDGEPAKPEPEPVPAPEPEAAAAPSA